MHGLFSRYMVALMVADLHFLAWPRQAKIASSLAEIQRMAAFFGKEGLPTIYQPI